MVIVVFCGYSEMGIGLLLWMSSMKVQLGRGDFDLELVYMHESWLHGSLCGSLVLGFCYCGEILHEDAY